MDGFDNGDGLLGCWWVDGLMGCRSRADGESRTRTELGLNQLALPLAYTGVNRQFHVL